MARYWLPTQSIKCNGRMCGATSHLAPAGNRRVVIECTKCQHFIRGDNESEVEKLWLLWVAEKELV